MQGFMFHFILQRFRITYVSESSSYRLMIQDIQETDGAIYQCQVIISLTDKEIAEVPLIVRQPPVISDNSTRSVVATEGQESRLNILILHSLRILKISVCVCVRRPFE